MKCEFYTRGVESMHRRWQGVVNGRVPQTGLSSITSWELFDAVIQCRSVNTVKLTRAYIYARACEQRVGARTALFPDAVCNYLRGAAWASRRSVRRTAPFWSGHIVCTYYACDYTSISKTQHCHKIVENVCRFVYRGRARESYSWK